MRNSNQYEELEDSVLIPVITKCPSKWLLIDKETGEAYVGNAKGYWDRLKPVIKGE